MQGNKNSREAGTGILSVMFHTSHYLSLALSQLQKIYSVNALEKWAYHRTKVASQFLFACTQNIVSVSITAAKRDEIHRL